MPRQAPKFRLEPPAGRWDRSPRQSAADVDSGRGRPGTLLTLTITGACLVMLGGLYMLWKQGALSPREVNAGPALVRQVPAHEAITLSLDDARKLMRQSEWAQAEAALRTAAGQFPEDQEVRIALAECLLSQKKYAESYEQYEKALAIGPREARLEFAAGLVASTAGMTDRALEHFGQAVVQDPRNAGYAMNLGLIQRRQGDMDAAKASLLRAANLDPQNATAWGSLADIAMGENKVDLALQHIARARALQPEGREWRLIEARAQKRRGDPERALMILLPMDATQRREAPVARLIAECFGMLQRHSDAAAAMAEASLAEPASADLAREAAVCFERAGSRERALEFARRAQMLGDAAAARIVERLSAAR
jgi:tetratricopeptide (TPR) repeat protein